MARLLVFLSLAGVIPNWMAWRDGEQTGWGAYACENVIPASASRLKLRREVKVGTRVGTRWNHRHLGVVPALIVGEDKDDVGRLGQGGRGKAKAKQQDGFD